MFQQDYNPLGSVAVSTLAAAIRSYAAVLHRAASAPRPAGRRAPRHQRAFRGALRRPVRLSGRDAGLPHAPAIRDFSVRYGRLSGLLGIIRIIIGAMFLYNLTLITGKFEIVKESIIHISFDRRLQVLADRLLVRRDHRGDLRLRDAGGHRRRSDGGPGILPFSRPS